MSENVDQAQILSPVFDPSFCGFSKARVKAMVKEAVVFSLTGSAALATYPNPWMNAPNCRRVKFSSLFSRLEASSGANQRWVCAASGHRPGRSMCQCRSTYRATTSFPPGRCRPDTYWVLRILLFATVT